MSRTVKHPPKPDRFTRKYRIGKALRDDKLRAAENCYLRRNLITSVNSGADFVTDVPEICFGNMFAPDST